MTTLAPAQKLQKQKWEVDLEHSSINFKVKHLMITNTSGAFSDFKVSVETAGDDFRSSKILVHINVGSITTGVVGRDNHLRSRDFFNVAQFPYITFESTLIEQINPSKFRVHGDLTIKAVKHSISFDTEYTGRLTDPNGNIKAGFNLETKINRMDYEVEFNFIINDITAVVGRDVKISANIVLVKQKIEEYSIQNDNEQNIKVVDIEEEQNYNTVQSMIAAYHTSRSQLPDIGFLQKIFPESFIFFKTREIVGGDFYWFDEVDGKIIVVVADATGHGMEGSLKAMMGISMLNQIINSETVAQPREILLRLHEAILSSVRKTANNKSAMLAMDIAIAVIDSNQKRIEYIGAFIPLYFFKKGQLAVIDALRFSAGSHFHSINDIHTTAFTYEDGDILLMLTDGFRDQYGGVNFKKMGSKAQRELLIKAIDRPFDQVSDYIQQEFAAYQSWVDQMDDVTVLGIKL